MLKIGFCATVLARIENKIQSLLNLFYKISKLKHIVIDKVYDFNVHFIVKFFYHVKFIRLLNKSVPHKHLENRLIHVCT